MASPRHPSPADRAEQCSRDVTGDCDALRLRAHTISADHRNSQASLYLSPGARARCLYIPLPMPGLADTHNSHTGRIIYHSLPSPPLHLSLSHTRGSTQQSRHQHGVRAPRRPCCSYSGGGDRRGDDAGRGGARGLRGGPRRVRGPADGVGDVPDVRAGQGDGARAHARLLRGAQAGGGGQQEVHVRARQGPRRAGAGLQDQRHARHGPALPLQQPSHLLRLPQDSGHVARRARGGDLQGVREEARVQRHRNTGRCDRWRGREEQHELCAGDDGRRRRRGAALRQQALLLPRVGAARLRLRRRVTAGRDALIHGRPAGKGRGQGGDLFIYIPTCLRGRCRRKPER